MQSTPCFGIDASGEELVIAASDGRHAPMTIRNEMSAICQWLDSLPTPAMVGIESTGGRVTSPAGMTVLSVGTSGKSVSPNDGLIA